MQHNQDASFVIEIMYTPKKGKRKEKKIIELTLVLNIA
jgi:hypothetical protein